MDGTRLDDRGAKSQERQGGEKWAQVGRSLWMEGRAKQGRRENHRASLGLMSRGPGALGREIYWGRECLPWHWLQSGTPWPQMVRMLLASLPQGSREAVSSAAPLDAGVGSSWPDPGLCPSRVTWARARGESTEAASEKPLRDVREPVGSSVHALSPASRRGVTHC